MKKSVEIAKKILIVSGFRIFPSNTGGHVHTSGIARSLARMGWQVTVYSLAGRSDDYGISSIFGRSHRVDQIETNLVEETNLGLFYGLVQSAGRRLDQPRVWQYHLMRHALVPRRLRKALVAADIVMSDLPWCPRIPGPWSSKPWFLISHNLEHSLLAQGDRFHRRYASWMQDVERAAPEEYSDIFPCAEADRDFFRANDRSGALQLPIIRCGVDPNSYQVPAGTRERIRGELGVEVEETLLVFSGSKFAPNLEALQVLREFSERHRNALAQLRVKILILGSMVATPFKDGALIATGRVPEVAPYFSAADVGLNPVTRGSGANVKLFEYLATRLPVISTAFGVRGTDLVPGIDFMQYEGDGLLSAIDNFVHQKDQGQWRKFAESVWQRHRNSCDIEQLVRDAVARRPEFSALGR
jgi:glycosyltransferase involved in cell wall biosynthesis